MAVQMKIAIASAARRTPKRVAMRDVCRLTSTGRRSRSRVRMSSGDSEREDLTLGWGDGVRRRWCCWPSAERFAISYEKWFDLVPDAPPGLSGERQRRAIGK